MTPCPHFGLERLARGADNHPVRLLPWSTLATLGLILLGVPAASAAVSREPVAAGFESPVHVTAPPGDGRRVMVVEQGGTVRVVRDGQVLAEPFLAIDSDLLSGGERGLLSIAFPPDYEASRYVYAYLTDAEGDIRVDQFRRAVGSRDRVEPGYRRPVIEVAHREAGNHNGGLAVFGPDGRLYLGTGDGGNGYDQPVRDARDTSSLLGKILRIEPLPGGGHAVPLDNPFGAVWAYGLRNPFRFSFDRLTGDLAIGDVGQSTVEEIDWVPHVGGVGAGRGANFGWDDCEGSLRAEPAPTGTDPCPLSGDVRPTIEKLRARDGFCSITGGVVVRDPALEELVGRYLYGDLCRSPIRSAVLGPTASGDREEPALAAANLVSFGEDACARVYTVEHGGRVSRVRDESPAACDLRVPEPPQAPGPGFGSAPPSQAPLSVRLGGSRRQRALRRGAVVVRVRCNQACGLRALGRLSLRRRARPLRLVQVVRRLAANRTATLRLRLARPAREAVRRALARRRRVTATVTVRARGADRRLRTARWVVRLVR